MKILIVDDEAQRYPRLLLSLCDAGVMRDDIHLVPSAREAQDKLANIKYDLLILDILLPLRTLEEPILQNSLDLLFEIHEGDTLNKPDRIIGITADASIVGTAIDAFQSQTWNVVTYSASNDEWMNRCVNCVIYLNSQRSGQSERPSYGVDLAIICALEKPELEEVLKLPWNWKSARPLDDNVFVREGHFSLKNREVSVAATFAPRMGMVSTALRAASVIQLLRPRLLAMCGICAGVQGKVRVGDVLLADPAWDFQSGKRVRDRENVRFSVAPHQLHSHTLVRSHVEQLRGDTATLNQLSVDYGSDAPNTTRVVIGPVASGSAVLADGLVIEEIKSQHRELIGIEMEAYGLYAAGHGASLPQPLAFALKGVCDFADPDKKDDHQRYAAYASANVLRLLMEKFGTRLLS